MKKKTWKIIVRHLVLALLAVIWLIPIVWLVVTSLSTTKGVSYQHFFPEHWTLANYHQLFFKTDTAANFPAWFKNTFIVAFFTCIVSSAFVLLYEIQGEKTSDELFYHSWNVPRCTFHDRCLFCLKNDRTYRFTCRSGYRIFCRFGTWVFSIERFL